MQIYSRFSYISIDDSVDDWLILQGVCSGFAEHRHEAQFDAVFLNECVQVGFAEFHDGAE